MQKDICLELGRREIWGSTAYGDGGFLSEILWNETWWLHNIMNVLNGIELFIFKWMLLFYKNIISIK